MLNYLQFINESYKTELVTIETDYVYDEDIDGTNEEEVLDLINSHIDNWHNGVSINVEILDLPENGWPLVEFTFNNLNDAFKGLMLMWGDDIELVFDNLIIALVKENRSQEIFDFIKIKDMKSLKNNIQEFPEEFIKNLKEEDKNLLYSIGVINKYNL